MPRVDGALTTHPRTLPVQPLRNASASSMQSPPARAEATRVRNLSPVLARTRGVTQVQVLVHQCIQTEPESQSGGQQQPSTGHQAVIIKGDVDAVGVLKW